MPRDEAQLWPTVVQHQRRRSLVHLNIARPVLLVARQRNPAVREHFPVLSEFAPAGVDAEC